jgi:hypothetical protein
MTVKRTYLVLVASAVALAACAESTSAPSTSRSLAPAGAHRSVVTDPATGHSYQLVQQSPINWYMANDGANAATLAGCTSAHLLTINSAEENTLVSALFNGGGWWIGGRNFTASADPAEGWVWVTGEPFSYISWRGGEPNNSNGNSFYRNEDALYVNLNPGGAVAVDYPAWGSDLDGYIVEFEGCAPPTPAAQAQTVISSIAALVAGGALSASDAGPVTTSLNQAIASLNRGNTNSAKGQLSAAANKINALVNSHRLSAANGEAITAAIQGIAASL